MKPQKKNTHQIAPAGDSFLQFCAFDAEKTRPPSLFCQMALMRYMKLYERYTV
jgi:hypothetical protein